MAEFRRAVHRSARESEQKWEDSRRLLDSAVLPSILVQLVERSQDAMLPLEVKAALSASLRQDQVHGVQDLDGAALKALTGYPPSKAVRSLCLYFGLVQDRSSRWPSPVQTSPRSPISRGSRLPMNASMPSGASCVIMFSTIACAASA